MSSRRAAPALWCLLAAILFGASAPLTKPLVEKLDAFALAGLLYAGASIGVLPLVARERRAERPTTRRRRSLALLAGVTLAGGILAPVALMMALRHAPASSVSLWLSLEPVATAILAALFFHEAHQRRIWLALVLVGGASLLLARGQDAGLAAIFATAACVLWGLDNNLVARIDDLSASRIVLVKSAVAACVNLAIGFVVFGGRASGGDAARAVAIGTLGYGLSIALFVAGAQQLGAVRAQLVFATAPFIGAVLSALLLRESFGVATVVAAVLMAIGAVLAATARHEHEHRHEALVHSHLHRHDDGHHEHAHAPGDEPASPGAWHRHEHAHDEVTHAHPHVPDVHHGHSH